MKRPAASMKRPAAAPSDVPPAMPVFTEKTGMQTVYYGPGKITAAVAMKAFRVYPDMYASRTDKRVPWGGDRAAAWQKCIDAIQEKMI